MSQCFSLDLERMLDAGEFLIDFHDRRVRVHQPRKGVDARRLGRVVTIVPAAGDGKRRGSDDHCESDELHLLHIY